MFCSATSNKLHQKARKSTRQGRIQDFGKRFFLGSLGDGSLPLVSRGKAPVAGLWDKSPESWWYSVIWKKAKQLVSSSIQWWKVRGKFVRSKRPPESIAADVSYVWRRLNWLTRRVRECRRQWTECRVDDRTHRDSTAAPDLSRSTRPSDTRPHSERRGY